MTLLIVLMSLPFAPCLQEGRDIGYCRAVAELSAILIALAYAAAITFHAFT